MLLSTDIVFAHPGSRTKGDIVTVTFSRPLKAANRFQHDWPTGAAKPAVWALGPLSQGSNAQQPIILFHIPNNAVRGYPDPNPCRTALL